MNARPGTEKMSSGQFARVLGSPGETPRLIGYFRLAWPLVLAAFVAGFLLRAACPWPAVAPSIAALLLVLHAVIVWAMFMRARRGWRSFHVGAMGEEMVARELGFLPSDCQVFNGVSLPTKEGGRPGADADHLVMTPNGLFVVETKNWDGPITVKENQVFYHGRLPSRDPLEQVKSVVQNLQSALEDCGLQCGRLQGVLCFVRNNFEAGIEGCDGVMICTRERLNDCLLSSAEQTLPPQHRSAIAHWLKQQVA